jgi:tetratricopeptide (TPR) repeat protein
MPDHALPDALWELVFPDDEAVEITDDLLQAFASEATSLGHRPGEALRRLAIALETRLERADWVTLSQVYDLAEQVDPDDVRIPHSRVVAAESYEGPRPRAEEWAAVLRAEALAPEDPAVQYSKGLCQYREHGTLDQALTTFERAIRLGAGPMAWLYRAHCLQDLQRWEEAVDAYLAVDVDALVVAHPEWAWRRWLVQALLAQCELAAGQIADAHRRSWDLVRELHAAPDDDALAVVMPLEQVVEQLGDEALARELAVVELQA